MTSTTEAYYRRLKPYSVDALWRYLEDLLPEEPRSKAMPKLWRYREIRPLLLEASEIVTAEEAERRVLFLQNPGLAPKAAATTNLYAGLQLVMPGEIAPAHHHAAAALRFVVEGSGGYTTVDGERVQMHPGDLVLTPSWTWHDHGNRSDEPVIWLDGLDLPLINHLEANFYGGALQGAQKVVTADDSSTRAFGGAGLRPSWSNNPSGGSRLIRYPWNRSEEILTRVAGDTAGSLTDGIIFAYTNSETGGPIMPTLGAFIQALKPRLHTKAHRHTSSTVYHVAKGQGTSIVDHKKLGWCKGDTFAVPGWAIHEHINDADDTAILFSFTDEPVLRALGLYREAHVESQN